MSALSGCVLLTPAHAEVMGDEIGSGSYFTIDKDVPTSGGVWVLIKPALNGGKFCMLVLHREAPLKGFVRKHARHLAVECVERGPSRARNSTGEISPRMYTKYVLKDAEVGLVVCDYEYGPRHLTLAEIVEASQPHVTFKALPVSAAGKIRSCDGKPDGDSGGSSGAAAVHFSEPPVPRAPAVMPPRILGSPDSAIAPQRQ